MSRKNYRARPEEGSVWITGASSGIGRAVALKLADMGWQIAATARSQSALLDLEQESGALRGRIRAFAGDVTDTAHMRSICRAIEAELGPLALLVANAGIYLPQDGLNADPEAFRTSIDVNLMGTVNALLPTVEVMKARGRGQVAVVSSVAGYRGLPTSAAYGATKAGLINLAESMKFDLDRAGITLQVVNPGFVDTPATRSNPFDMPHLISVEDAAAQIVKGLDRPGTFEIAFPRAFVRQLKLLRLLPDRLYFRLVARSTGWDKKSAG
ncbi:SDR family NAD(P)-dependent oxidoreductase [Roseibium aggregatum]|uniref:SDR family NAD(P)-dependent oxidoreductase n=1 Tax=Roseibium aggregatum TaxID=187304 RepID=A0A939J3R9_9HYPH|nr:SDR family NAD(P)-dependent oxidoreductase [Roseibium aggregatum]MBN9670425.1 SDR family NAD(P)-dependent oxidoreductase [Roseibium aggregatum]